MMSLLSISLPLSSFARDHRDANLKTPPRQEAKSCCAEMKDCCKKDCCEMDGKSCEKEKSCSSAEKGHTPNS